MNLKLGCMHALDIKRCQAGSWETQRGDSNVRTRLSPLAVQDPWHCVVGCGAGQGRVWTRRAKHIRPATPVLHRGCILCRVSSSTPTPLNPSRRVTRPSCLPRCAAKQKSCTALCPTMLQPQQLRFVALQCVALFGKLGMSAGHVIANTQPLTGCILAGVLD